MGVGEGQQLGRPTPLLTPGEQGLLLDVVSLSFWVLAVSLALRHYMAKIDLHCKGSAVLSLSGQWLPNSSSLCQVVDDYSHYVQ